MSKEAISVLIIDDFNEFCATATKKLTELGFNVVGCAHNGPDGLSKIRAKSPDVVLLDVTLPIFDGIEVFQRTKHLNLEKQPIFILMSSFSSPYMLNEATSMGVEYFIMKPFNLNVLATRIKQIYNHHYIKDNTLSSFNTNSGSPLENQNKDKKVSMLLIELGLSPNTKGFKYIKAAIFMCFENLSVSTSITKHIYPDIAKMYKTKAICVERAIRHSIESLWKNISPEHIKNYFNNELTEKRPTNGKFIAHMTRIAKRVLN